MFPIETIQLKVSQVRLRLGHEFKFFIEPKWKNSGIQDEPIIETETSTQLRHVIKMEN